MNTVELAAAACGLMGTLLLATKGKWAGWGFVAFLLSNTAWIAFAAAHGHWAMLVQQVGFTVSSLLGIWVWLLSPMLDKMVDEGTGL